MRNRFSFFILSTSGAPVRQFCLPAALVGTLAVLALAGVSALAWMTHDYFQLRKRVHGTAALKERIARQDREIDGQRRQIRAFAQTINGLKSRIVDLNNFEKKIRIIANIEESEDQDGLFGVGGPTPEDLDTGIPLKENHDSLVREMHTQADQLQEAAAVQAGQFASLVDWLEDRVDLLASTPAIRPADGWITSGFGHRVSPFTGRKEFHKGVDISNRKGTPILATADGVVVYAGRKGFLGNTVTINHGHGLVSRYGHADKLMKKKGEAVRRGETVALMGSSGRTTGSHVHYEVLLNGIPVNPKKYFLN